MTSRLASARSRIESSALLLCGVAVLVGVLKYGIAMHPEWRRFYDAAQHWPDLTASPLMMETDRALLSNITAAGLAGLLHLTRLKAYLGFQVVLSLAAIALPFVMASIRTRPRQARLLFLLLVGGPVIPLVLSWTGGYDAFIVIGAALAALTRRAWISGLGWMLLAFNHASIAVVMLALWLPMMWVLERDTRNRVIRSVCAGAGLVIGWLAIRVLTSSWGGSTDRFTLFRSIGWDNIWHAYWQGMPIVVFTVLGVGWLVVLSASVRRTVPGRLLIAEALASVLLLPLVAVDETRISALAILASMFAFVAHSETVVGPGALDLIWRRTWIAAVIIPVPIVWQGELLYVGWGRIGDFLGIVNPASVP